MNFQWRSGRERELSAQLVGRRVLDIEARDGVCRPAALVESARSVSDPLHGQFEWVDDVAAERYREWQARAILNTIEVVVEDHSPAPAFVSVQITESTRGYKYVPTLDRDERAFALSECRRQLNGLRRRYSHLAEFADVWKAVDEATDEDNAT